MEYKDETKMNQKMKHRATEGSATPQRRGRCVSIGGFECIQ
ncbi:MAG: hypothetical protein Hyperionvirus16_35 [Hyperionvirus sp.]|uniref:Uncharacterized protein n=1 Tax=Hyperionvirus sp. TaxID=2487770 RepID=A0A3G5A9Y2_9VIRU|nr:MAG: hypothetical protein Hyperionvirus16_35 [Hyperionvirus sp.]